MDYVLAEAVEWKWRQGGRDIAPPVPMIHITSSGNVRQLSRYRVRIRDIKPKSLFCLRRC